jgi:hypothetical protein
MFISSGVSLGTRSLFTQCIDQRGSRHHPEVLINPFVCLLQVNIHGYSAAPRPFFILFHFASFCSILFHLYMYKRRFFPRFSSSTLFSLLFFSPPRPSALSASEIAFFRKFPVTTSAPVFSKYLDAQLTLRQARLRECGGGAGGFDDVGGGEGAVAVAVAGRRREAGDRTTGNSLRIRGNVWPPSGRK